MYFYKRDKYKQLRVFKLKFDCGEFDMVIHDPEAAVCRLFEIKHAIERDVPLLRHLLDPDKLACAECNIGRILFRTVLSRGRTISHTSGVKCGNLQPFLRRENTSLGMQKMEI